MTTKKSRSPSAFEIDKEPQKTSAKTQKNTKRTATAFDPSQDDLVLSDDFLERELEQNDEQREAMPSPKKGFSFFKIVAATATLLIGLAFGLWVDALIADLFSRHNWLGWIGSGLTILLVAGLLGLIISELSALMRFRSAETLRKEIDEKRNDMSLAHAHKIGKQVVKIASRRPETAKGRAELENIKSEIMDGADYLELTEKELLHPLDAKAKALISASAKRVSVVTAISPKALIDTAYILYEMLRLLRAIATIYGIKPGTLGTLRLIKTIIGQLAIAGTISIGENIAEQFIGHGIAAKISTRFGEGVINGLLATRFGILAMEVTRPMPFHAISRPKIKDLIKELSFSDPSEQKK